MNSTEGAVPLTVASLVSLVETDGPEGVRRAVGGWVLVGDVPAEEGAREWSFRTLSARTVRFTEDALEGILNESFLAFGVQKPRTRSFANTLLIGRSRSNDICLAHSSISKLHARIRIVSDDELWLSDAGSSNGTTYDREPLTGGVERRLRHATIVRFGTISLQVFDTGRFVPLLERLSRIG